MQARTKNAALILPNAMRAFVADGRVVDVARTQGKQTRTKRSKIIYWATTSFLGFGMLSQGFAQVFLTKGYVDIVIAHLGYPSYFLYIIGVWKIVGVIALLIPGFGLLKEWAYAGFFFVMSGALFSHIASHDPAFASLPALFLLTLIVTSWYFRPADRRVISENQ